MTASTKPKTPSMVLPVRPSTSTSEIQRFCKKANRLTLSQVIDKVIVTEQLAKTRRRSFTISISFYPKEEYYQEYDITTEEILAVFGGRFPLHLRKEIQIELKKLQVDLKTIMINIGQGKTEKRNLELESAEADDDDTEPHTVPGDDTSEIGDGDAGEAKRARQTKEMATYDSDDSEEDIPLTEYDDAALEAEFADKDEEEIDASRSVSTSTTKKSSKETLLRKIEESFTQIIPQATAFKFVDNQVRIEIEVCYLLCSIFIMVNQNR